MFRSAAFSAFLHVSVFLIAWFGLPHLLREAPLFDAPVPVEIVTIAEITNVPTPEPEPEKPEPPPPPPEPPPPEAMPEPVSETEPAEPEPPQEAVPPPPKPKLKPAPKPKPKPKPPQHVKITEKPRPKPEPPKRKEKAEKEELDWRSVVLKTVEKHKQKAQPKKEKEAKFKIKIKPAAPRTFDKSAPITISELDAVRQQFIACWNIPAGARDAENLVVDIHVEAEPDGTVRAAEIMNRQRMNSDPFFRAAAESALRAVYNPRCNPLKLPAEKYDRWKTLTLSFNPKQMFGK